MTLPVVENRFTGQTGSNGTSHSVTLPATVNRGDLLILVAGTDGNPSQTAPSGWSTLMAATPNGVNNSVAVFGKSADGTEDSAAVVWTTSAAEQTSTVGFRISGWAGTLADIKFGTAVTGATTTPDSPSLNPPDYTTEDFLWVAFGCADANKSVSSGISGFTQNFIQGSTTNGCSTWSYDLAQNNNLKDPGTLTLSGADDWVVNTMAILGTKTLFTDDSEGRGTGPSAGTDLSSTNTFWDLFNGVGTRKFASTPKHAGSFSSEFVTAGTGQALVKDNTSLPGTTNGGVAQKQLWYRFYLRVPTAGAIDIDNRIAVVEQSPAGGGADIACIRINGDGTVSIMDGTTVRATTTHTVEGHNHWHRLELWVDQNSDYMELRMWWAGDADSSSTGASNYESINGSLTNNNDIEVFGVGNYAGINGAIYIDDVAIGVGGWQGPVVGITDVDMTESLAVAFSNSVTLVKGKNADASLPIGLANTVSFSSVQGMTDNLAISLANSVTLTRGQGMSAALPVVFSNAATLVKEGNTTGSLAISFSNAATLVRGQNTTGSLAVAFGNSLTLDVVPGAGKTITLPLAIVFSDTVTLARAANATANLAIGFANSFSIVVEHNMQASLAIAFSNTLAMNHTLGLDLHLPIGFNNTFAGEHVVEMQANLDIDFILNTALQVPGIALVGRPGAGQLWPRGN